MGKNLKIQMTPERQEEVLGYFDAEYGFALDLAEESQMKGLMEQYLFYDSSWTERNVRVCHCTSCGGFESHRSKSTATFFAHSSGDSTDCPNCGNGVTLKAIGRMRSFASINDADERRFSIFRVAPDGGLLVVSGWGRRTFSFNELSPDIAFREKERQYFGPGERMRWKRVWEYDGLGRTGTAHPVGWEPCDFMAEPHNPTINLTSDGSYYVICAERIEDTKLKYCLLEDWYYDRCKVWLSDTCESVRFVHKFLSLYTEYPNIEMACRLGFWGAVDDLVDSGRKNAKLLDWGAKTSWGFLRLNKADCKAFLKADGDMGDLQLLAAARKWDKKLSLSRFWELLEYCHNDSRVTELVVQSSAMSKLSPQKIIHYLTVGDAVSRTKAQMLADYLSFAKILKYDLRQQDVALPKNLTERHDAAAAAVAIIQAAHRKEESARKYGKRVREVQQMYEFSLGSLSVLAPLTPQEIVDEGKKQHHCVGGYAARHFEGVLEILFLRKTAEPLKPWITIELAHRSQPTGKVTIRQMYDASNRHGLLHWKKEIGWFIDAWTGWLQAGSPRDENGLPIIKVIQEAVA